MKDKLQKQLEDIKEEYKIVKNKLESELLEYITKSFLNSTVSDLFQFISSRRELLDTLHDIEIEGENDQSVINAIDTFREVSSYIEHAMKDIIYLIENSQTNEKIIATWNTIKQELIKR